MSMSGTCNTTSSSFYHGFDHIRNMDFWIRAILRGGLQVRLFLATIFRSWEFRGIVYLRICGVTVYHAMVSRSQFSWRPSHFTDWPCKSNERWLQLYSANRKKVNIRQRLVFRAKLLSCDKVTIDGVCIGNWIYWTLKQLVTALYNSLSHTDWCFQSPLL
jgi:hypothetical protein